MSALADVERILGDWNWHSRIVYVFQAGEDGPLKIGKVDGLRSLSVRWKTLQTGCPEELLLCRLIENADAGLEGRLHRRFAAHRLRGEWFAPVPELLAFAAGGK